MISVWLCVACAVSAATPCENLKSLPLPNTTITTSELVMAARRFPAHAARGAAPARGWEQPNGARPPSTRWCGCGEPSGAGGPAVAVDAEAPAARRQHGHFCRIVAFETVSITSMWSLGCRPQINGTRNSRLKERWLGGSIQGFGDMQNAIRAVTHRGTDTGHTMATLIYSGHPDRSSILAIAHP